MIIFWTWPSIYEVELFCIYLSLLKVECYTKILFYGSLHNSKVLFLQHNLVVLYLLWESGNLFWLVVTHWREYYLKVGLNWGQIFDHTSHSPIRWRTVVLQFHPYKKCIFIAHSFGLIKLTFVFRNIFFNYFHTKNSWNILLLIHQLVLKGKWDRNKTYSYIRSASATWENK